MGKLRIGLIGGGPGSMIGPVHRAAIGLTGDFEIVAGSFSSNYQSSLQLAESIGIPELQVYRDFRSMANDAKKLKLDAVAILTPNYLHIEVATAFISQGIHVICEKPLGSSMEGVKELEDSIIENKTAFVLTHTYSAYPVIRKARDIISSGELGEVRMISVEYLQGWLSNLVENDPINRGAVWRENPEKGGEGGVLGDIGTHAFHLAEYITGLKTRSLLSMVTSIPGRAVPDDAKLLLDFENGATGSLWCSQVAVGALNGLNIRIFGEHGSLTWCHSAHEELHLYDSDNIEKVYHKGQGGDGTLPPGHPEGYYEGFAQLYRDFAKEIRTPGSKYEKNVPGIESGKRGLHFIDASLESTRKGNIWVNL